MVRWLYLIRLLVDRWTILSFTIIQLFKCFQDIDLTAYVLNNKSMTVKISLKNERSQRPGSIYEHF